jgi:hypothetical protein
MTDAPESVWLDRDMQPWRVWTIEVSDLPRYVPAERIAALEEANARLRAGFESIANAKPLFSYVGCGPNGIDFDDPGSPFDRGKAEGYAELQAMARAALEAPE